MRKKPNPNMVPFTSVEAQLAHHEKRLSEERLRTRILRLEVKRLNEAIVIMAAAMRDIAQAEEDEGL